MKDYVPERQGRLFCKSSEILSEADAISFYCKSQIMGSLTDIDIYPLPGAKTC